MLISACSIVFSRLCISTIASTTGGHPARYERNQYHWDGITTGDRKSEIRLPAVIHIEVGVQLQETKSTEGRPARAARFVLGEKKKEDATTF